MQGGCPQGSNSNPSVPYYANACLGGTSGFSVSVVDCSDPTAAVIKEVPGTAIPGQVSNMRQDVHYGTCLGNDGSGNAVAMPCGTAPLLTFRAGFVQMSGLCLTAATKADGAAATFATCDATNNNQQFNLTGLQGWSGQQILTIKDSQYCLQFEPAGNADF